MLHLEQSPWISPRVHFLTFRPTYKSGIHVIYFVVFGLYEPITTDDHNETHQNLAIGTKIFAYQ